MITLHFHLLPQYKYELFHIYFTSCLSARYLPITRRCTGLLRETLYVIICEQHQVEIFLKLASFAFEGTNTLIVLDDYPASKDVKGRTGELVKLGFSARHAGISVWVLTQQLSSIVKPFRENVSAIVLFYMPSTKSTKAIFEEYVGELSHDELKQMITSLKKRHFGHIIFSLRKPYSIEQK